MITSLIIIAIAFVWLGYETDWLTVRLLSGAIKAPRYYSRSEIHELAKRIGWTYKLHKGADYFSALAKEWITPITGWDWIFEHEHDLDDYQPLILLRMNGNRYAMTVKKLSVLKDIIKVNATTHKPKQIVQLSKPQRHYPWAHPASDWDALIPLENALKTI